jgi:hypothetical protein
MIRGTTPTFIFSLPFDVSNIKSAYITIKSRWTEVEKAVTDCSLNGTTITVKLTQEETLALPESQIAGVQLRVLTNDNEALASDVFPIKVEEILKEGVIE